MAANICHSVQIYSILSSTCAVHF